MFTQSSNFCRPSGVLDIRIISSAYMRQDMKEPLGSLTADEFILSRLNAKLQPLSYTFHTFEKICCFSLNFYCTVRVFIHAFNNSKEVSSDIKTFKF